jgi:phosphate transport system substrate-binding protein
MRKRTLAVFVSAIALTLVAAACSSNNNSSTNGGTNGGSASGTPLTGAGSTFVYPMYQVWGHNFQQVESGAQINYQAVGSGGGITGLQTQTIDFGDSDAPLQSSDLLGFKAKVLTVPVTLGAVVMAYNVPGLTKPLNLDGPTAAGIFLGTIKNWDDPAIAKLNPGVKLPNLPITTVHRADSSGTTFIFTSWLSEESSAFSSKVGADKSVEWPGGSSGVGNSGVASLVQQTKGAVGYIEYQFAVTTHLGVADVKGKNSSTFVAPSVQSTSAAAGGLKLPITSDTNILDSTAPGAYPIASATYTMNYQDLTALGKAKAQTFVDMLHYILTTGQSQVEALHYAPLPSSVDQQALALLGQFTYKGTPLKPTGT